MRARMIKNTGAYMVMGLTPYFVKFFMIPIYTRHMDPADYGIVSMINALTAFIAAFVGLKLASGLSRYFFDYDARGVKEFFSTVLYSILLVDLVLFVVMHFVGDSLVGLVFRKVDIPYYPCVFLGIVTVIFAGLVAYFNLLLRMQERGGIILVVSLVNAAVIVVLGVYFVVYRGMRAYGMLLASALGAIVNAAVLFMVIRCHVIRAFRLSMLRQSVSFGLPIIPHALGRVLFAFSDRLILGFFVPVAGIGLYSLADRLSGLLGVAVQSFDAANQPNFMRLSKQNKREAVRIYRTLITKWAAAMAFLYLFLALFSEEVLHVLTPPEYHAAYQYVPILLGGCVFHGLYYFTTGAIMFEKKTRLIPLITVTAGIVNVVANLMLIPRFGVVAAAWTTLAAFALTFLISLWLSRAHYPLEYEWKQIGHIFGLMLVLFLVATAAKGENPWINAGIKLVATGLFAGVLLKWNYGNVTSDLAQFARYLSKRAGSKG